MTNTAIAKPNTQPGLPEALTEAISEALSLMGAVMANPKPHSAILVKAWAMALHNAGITAADVSGLTSRVMSSQTFFPTPADFIAAHRPAIDTETQAEAAWQAVLGAVRRVGRNGSLVAADLGGDGAALWTLERLGWVRLCSELGIGWDGKDNRPFYRAEFIRTYRLAMDSGATLEYLPGALALQNDGDGRPLTPALVGRPDWAELPAAALQTQRGPREEFAAMQAGAFSALASGRRSESEPDGRELACQEAGRR